MKNSQKIVAGAILAGLVLPTTALASGPRQCDIDGTCDPYQPDPTIVEPTAAPVAPVQAKTVATKPVSKQPVAYQAPTPVDERDDSTNRVEPVATPTAEPTVNPIAADYMAADQSPKLPETGVAEIFMIATIAAGAGLYFLYRWALKRRANQVTVDNAKVDETKF